MDPNCAVVRGDHSNGVETVSTRMAKARQASRYMETRHGLPLRAFRDPRLFRRVAVVLRRVKREAPVVIEAFFIGLKEAPAQELSPNGLDRAIGRPTPIDPIDVVDTRPLAVVRGDSVPVERLVVCVIATRERPPSLGVLSSVAGVS